MANTSFKAATVRHRQRVAGLPLSAQGCGWPARVGFGDEKVALGQDFLEVFLLHPLSIIPPMLQTHSHSFIDTNLIHNFLYKLHKIKFLYMFRASSAHLQEVNDHCPPEDERMTLEACRGT